MSKTQSDVATQTCNACRVEKNLSEFNRSTASKTGRMRTCRVCANERSREWQRMNSERAKQNLSQWRAANPDKRQSQINRALLALYALDPGLLARRARERRAANPDKYRAISKRWRKANRESDIARTRSWREKNRTLVIRYRREYLRANMEAALARGVAWRKKNPDAVRRYGANRRARKKAGGGRLSPGISNRLFALQRGRCACGCGERLGSDYHLDHVIPLARGGANVDSNMQLLRKACNLRKSSKDPVDFMREQGFLL